MLRYKFGSAKEGSDDDAIVAKPFSTVGFRGISVAGFDDLRRCKELGDINVEGSEPTVASSWAYAERYHPTFRGP